MTTFDYETHKVIDAPIQQVWDYLVTHDEWRRPFIRSVRQIEGDGLEVGARYENEAKMGGMTIPVVNEITVVDSPRHLQWRQVNDDELVVTTEGNYFLEALDENQTRFTLRNSYSTRIPGASAFMPWVMDKLMAPKLTRQLADGVAAMD